MAVINKENSYMEFPLQLSRQYGAPIDKYSVFYEMSEAQTYATTSPLAYVGQLIVVVDEANQQSKAYLIKDTVGNLEEVGADASAPMLFVDDEAAMLALTDIEVGQQVYRYDTKTIWIFKGEDASTITNWVESAADSDTVWHGTKNKIIFQSMTPDQYKAVSTKDSNTLYFVSDSDTGVIYKGDVDVTKSIINCTTFPEDADAIPYKLYFNTDTFELKYYKTGTGWIQVSPGYLGESAVWDDADGSKMATIALIKKGIKEAIDKINKDASFTESTGTVKVDTGAGAVLTGVAHGATYDSTKLKITIPMYGKDDLVIDIPKDKFVTAGQYYEDYPATGTATHHKVIVLTIDNQDDPVIIPAEALVNIYTADNTNKDITITVTDDNKISAQAKIDPVEGNALISTASGLKVDLSAKLDKLANASGSKIVTSKADGTIEESLFSVQSTGDMSENNTDVPVASVVRAFVTAAIAALQESLEEKINKKVDKVEGTVDNIVVFGASGAIKDSNKSIGGATLKDNPDENTIATEAAVADAFSWKDI